MFDHFTQNPVAAEPPPPQKVLRFDKGYWKTMPGILKIVELVSLNNVTQLPHPLS